MTKTIPPSLFFKLFTQATPSMSYNMELVSRPRGCIAKPFFWRSQNSFGHLNFCF